MRILIAEDDSVSRRILKLTLKNLDYEVIETENGNDALKILEGPEAPSLAILDVMMPGIDGMEVCRRIRRNLTQNPPFIVLLTARDRKEDVIKGIEAGADDYLIKPFDREELRVRLNVGTKTVQLQLQLAERIRQLESALAQIKQLQGILPICSYCKNIRDDKNYWQNIESYVSSHSETTFSHGICPDCYENVVRPQIDKLKKSDDSST